MKGGKMVTRYNGSMTDILDEALGIYASLGFSLTEVDDHELDLHYQEKIIARLNPSTATFSVIRSGCANYLNNIRKN